MRTEYEKRTEGVLTGLAGRWIIAAILFLGMLLAVPTCVNANPTSVKLKLNKATSAYDITGDGKKDTIRITASHDSFTDMYYNLTVYVNRKQVFRDPEKSFYFYDFEGALYTLKNGKPFLYLFNPGDDYYGSVCGLFQYRSGKLRSVFNFNTFYRPGYHNGGEVVKVSGNSMTVRLGTMSYALAGFSADFVLNYKNGTLALASRTGTIHQIGAQLPAYPKLRYNVKLYSSRTSSKSAGTLKRGTGVKITKVYVGRKFVRFLMISQSGKRGWYQSQAGYISGRQPLLEGTFYAG